MYRKKLCLVCGKETRNPKFCSMSCSAIFNNINRSKFNKCLNCGKETKKPKFCSRDCFIVFTTKKIKHTNYCLNCGKEISNESYCSLKCQNDKKYKNYIEKWLKEEVSGDRGIKCIHLSNYVTRWMHETRNNKCENCGFDTPHPRTGKSILEVHHKDENPENTIPENLSLLCPNCHALTDSRNSKKGNGRRYYREQYHINGRNGETAITPTL